jgi:hypothetical protein
MSATNPYCTLAAVQSEIGNDSEDNDTVLYAAIEQASRFIDSHTNRKFYGQTFTEEVPYTVPRSAVTSPETVALPFIIRSFGGVMVDGEVLSSEYYSVEGYSILAEKIEGYAHCAPCANITYPIFWEESRRKVVKVWGSFGYTPAASSPATTPPSDLPAEITRAAVLIASAFSGLNTHDYISVTGERQNVNDNKIPLEAINLLKPHRYIASF